MERLAEPEDGLEEAEFVKEAKAYWGLLERFWKPEVEALGLKFRPSKLVIYDGQVRTGCGLQKEVASLFYCPLDGRTYLSLEMWLRLETEFEVVGPSTRAYALAHEYAHHVTTILGIMGPILGIAHGQKQNHIRNRISVVNELWADGLAGYFLGAMAREGRLSGQEVDRILTAALKLGDDMIHKHWKNLDQNSYRHGSSIQRRNWVQKGMLVRHFSEIRPHHDHELTAKFHESLKAEIQNLAPKPVRFGLYAHTLWSFLTNGFLPTAANRKQ